MLWFNHFGRICHRQFFDFLRFFVNIFDKPSNAATERIAKLWKKCFTYQMTPLCHRDVIEGSYRKNERGNHPKTFELTEHGSREC